MDTVTVQVEKYRKRQFQNTGISGEGVRETESRRDTKGSFSYLFLFKK